MDDLKYIEKLAREDHNMVGKNEVPLFIVDEQEKQQNRKQKLRKRKITAVQSILLAYSCYFLSFSYICTMQLTLILKEGYNTYCIKIFKGIIRFMSLEVGAIVEGEVTGITNFGAFVQLPEGKVGLIHISEVSNVYVKDVHDF